jgi:hypothetical protein
MHRCAVFGKGISGDTQSGLRDGKYLSNLPLVGIVVEYILRCQRRAGQLALQMIPPLISVDFRGVDSNESLFLWHTKLVVAASVQALLGQPTCFHAFP